MNYDIDTLKEKLQSGDITIDQFTDAFTKFNDIEHEQIQRGKDLSELQYYYKEGIGEEYNVDSIKSVERYVKKEIYPTIKFLSDSDDDYYKPDFTITDVYSLTQTHKIANRLLTVLNLGHYDVKRKVMWWISYRKIIKKKIAALRATDIRCLQKLFINEYLLNKNIIDSSFEDLLSLCSSNDKFANDLLDYRNISIETYVKYMDISLTVTVGRKRFESSCAIVKLSGLLNVPTEAFLLLVFENAFKRWEANASKQYYDSIQVRQNSSNVHNNEYEDIALCLYQESRVTTDNKISVGAWTNEGMTRYNELIDMVIECRKMRGDFEELLKRHFKENALEDIHTSSKRKSGHEITDADRNVTTKKVKPRDTFMV